MRRALISTLLVLASCSTAGYAIGGRRLVPQSSLYDAPDDSAAQGAMVMLVDVENGCEAYKKLDCARLNAEVPPFDTIVLLVPDTKPGEHPLRRNGAAALIGFHDEPGKREVVSGNITLAAPPQPPAKPDDHLRGTFSLSTVAGTRAEGAFDAARCPGLHKRIVECLTTESTEVH